MSEESWKLEKFLCRCCLNEGAHKNLAVPFKTPEGEEEIYSEMLIESININLTPVPGPMCSSTYSICEECILRLRDAFSFKQQVLLSEKRFQDLYNNRNITQSNSSGLDVKLEVPSDNEDSVKLEMDEDNFRLSYDDDGGGGDTKSDGEQESIEERKPRGRKTKAKDKDGQKSRKRARKPKDDAATNEKKGRTAGRFRLTESDYVQVTTADGSVYQCSRCERRYDKLYTLKSHVKTKHYRIPKFACPYCDQAFMTPAPLTVHKLDVHEVDDRFKCNACKGVFNTKVQLRKHMNNFHMMGERYKCDLCEYESFSFEGMYKHKFKHKTVKDYHCRYCRKAFLRKATLDLHERIHTGDRRKVCAECGKAFVQKASLNYHMTKHHPEVNF